MAFGLGVLRLSPDAFWRMTLPELKAAAGLSGTHPSQAPDRIALRALMTRYPDTQKENGHDRS
ncbi:MAG: phage tail assembly chaperone [Pseudomonadota bacterium]